MTHCTACGQRLLKKKLKREEPAWPAFLEAWWGRFGAALAVDGVKDFLAVNRDFFRSDDAQAHFVAANFHDNDRDVVVDDD